MTDTVDLLLETYDNDVQDIVQALREALTAAYPDFTEEVKMGWKNIVYTHEGTPICSISPHTQHVNLHFDRGTELTDPHDLLRGEGKKLRHLRFESLDDVKPDLITPFINEALVLE